MRPGERGKLTCAQTGEDQGYDPRAVPPLDGVQNCRDLVFRGYVETDLERAMAAPIVLDLDRRRYVAAHPPELPRDFEKACQRHQHRPCPTAGGSRSDQDLVAKSL